MAVVLLNFVEKSLRVTSFGESRGEPESGGLPREAHNVAHCIRKEGYTFTVLVDRLGLTPDVGDRLGIRPEALRYPTTFCHSLDPSVGHCCALLRSNSATLVSIIGFSNSTETHC